MAANSQAKITVWDAPTRLFHWGLVALAVVLAVSGELGRMDVHALAGESCIALVTFRVIWGVIGSRTSRFTDFVRQPRAVLAYATGKSPHHRPGHNPLGGWMVVVLLCALLAQGVLGLFSNDDILFDGPLSHLVGKHASDLATSLHKGLFLVLCGLVALHVGAVLFHWLVLRDNLVRPMLTGQRAGPPHQHMTPVSSWRAVAALAAAAAIVWAALRLL